MSDNVLKLKPGDHRVLEGAPWVYRGEIFRNTVQPGAVATLLDSQGRLVGRGLYNPRSIIALRLLTRTPREQVNAQLFQERIRQAVRYREEVLPRAEAFRVVNAEADGIPGLIIDKYGSMIVVEVLSLGLQPFMDVIVATLIEVFHPQGIFERGEMAVREREGLPLENKMLYGQIPSSIHIDENGIILRVDLEEGQKTGHFLDQSQNRRRIADFAKGRRVFDAFCHSGAFGLHAAKAGAEHVVGIDIDADAIGIARENSALNHLGDRTEFVAANAFDWLREQSHQGEKFDLGILDPPAFTKSKETIHAAIKGYKEINLRALKLIRSGGYLATSSCSFHLSEQEFIRVIQNAAHDARRSVRIVEIRGQSPDHPILPALPETRYLKFLILKVD